MLNVFIVLLYFYTNLITKDLGSVQPQFAPWKTLNTLEMLPDSSGFLSGPNQNTKRQAETVCGWDRASHSERALVQFFAILCFSPNWNYQFPMCSCLCHCYIAPLLAWGGSRKYVHSSWYMGHYFRVWVHMHSQVLPIALRVFCQTFGVLFTCPNTQTGHSKNLIVTITLEKMNTHSVAFVHAHIHTHKHSHPFSLHPFIVFIPLISSLLSSVPFPHL